jgi:hypothetical protein
VDCLLPFFDKDTVEEVVKALREGSADTPTFGRVLINPKEMKPNPAATAAVWEKFVSLPSQTRPQRGAKPPIRLTALAHELAWDGLLPDAGQKAHAAMHKVLDTYLVGRAREFAAQREKVMTVEGRTIEADLRSGKTRDKTFQTEADYVVVNDAYRRAARVLSPDIARTYTEVLAKRKPEGKDDFEWALIEAREDIAALGLMENLQVFFDAEATKQSDAWLAKYRDRIKRLPDDRQDAYRQISALSREAQDIELAKPVTWIEATAVRETDGRETQLPTHKHHLLCDEKGLYPTALEAWESKVLQAEMRRPGFKFWYRNPGRPSQDSLGVAYVAGDEVSIVRPDFLFFCESADRSVVADIVDPHGTHLADALPKLRGLARYSETHPGVYRRIEAVAEAGGRMRVLDLTRADVRKAVAEANDAKSLYEGALAGDYK